MRRKPGRRMKDMAKRGMVGLLTVSMCLSHVQGIAFADNRVEVGEVEVDGQKITLSLRGDSIMDAAKAAFEDAHLYENEYLGVSRDAKTQAAYRTLTDGTNPLYEMDLFSEEEMQALEDAGVEVKALIQMDQEQAEAEGNLKPATESNALRATEEENTQLVVFDPKKEGKKDLLLYKQDSLFASFYDQFSNQLMNQTTTEITAADPASYEINGDEKVTFILINHADDSRVLNLKLNDATLEKSIKLPKAETVITGVMHTLDEKGIDDTTESANPSAVPTQEATTADSTTADANASTEASTEAAATTDATEANAETQLPAESETTAAATETLPQEGQIESENVKSEATEAAPEHKTLAETMKEALAQAVETVKETITAVEETFGVIHSEAAENEGSATESEVEKETTAAAAEEKKESTKTEMDTALKNERKDLLKNTKASELVDSSVASAKVLQYTLDDLSKAYWSAEIKGEYEVNVFAEKTAFDADDQVKLQLKKLDKPEEAEDGTLATTDDTLSKEQVDALRADGSYENSQSIDIRFVDEDGKEVEPKTPVKVKIKVYKDVLPEDADISTMTIKHLDESTGSVQAATVASYGETANGAIKAVDEQGKKVELKSVDADTAEVADEEVEAASVAASTTKEVLPEDAVGVESTFTVKSFSAFAITYGAPNAVANYVYDVPVKFVRVTGNGNKVEIDSSNKTLGTIANNSREVREEDLKKYIPKDFIFSKVKLVRNNKNFSYSAYDENNFNISSEFTRKYIIGHLKPTYSWEYRKLNGSTESLQNGDTIYVICTQLERVDTIDNSGFHLYLTDFDENSRFKVGDWNDDGGNSQKGTLRQGLYSKLTVKDDPEDLCGYPTLTGQDYLGETDYSRSMRGKSIKKWCGDGEHSKRVHNLFLQSQYDADGSYFYDSGENFAKLDTDSKFIVYNQLGTPSRDNYYPYERGNFLPYNTLDTDNTWNHNLYDENGRELDDYNPRKGEPVYGLKEGPNFYFGLYGYAQFYQPLNGEVNGKPMVYEFSGDDDLLVYLDGVLVLDLGGVHEAQSGSINFKTGEVKWTNTNQRADEYNKNHPNQWVSNYSTTIFNQFKDAYDNDTSKLNIDKDWNRKENPTTFKAGSEHLIQFFYMERGAGASNLKLKVNIPPIPDGSLNITKEVTGLNENQNLNEKYTFKLTDEAGNKITNKDYTVNGGPTKSTGADGIVTIAADETATVEGIKAGTKVKVQEVVNSGSKYDYVVNYGSLVDGDSNVEVAKDNTSVTATIPTAGHVGVKVTNDVSRSTKSLIVKKQFKVNGTLPSEIPLAEDFAKTTFSLFESADGKNYKQVGASIPYDSENFKDGEHTFAQLDPNKIYKVVENLSGTVAQGGTPEKPYIGTSIVAGETSVTTKKSENLNPEILGIDLNSVSKVTFTNVYQTPSVNVQFKKVDSKTRNMLKNAEFEVTKDEQKITLKDDKGNTLIDDGKLVITDGVKELELSNGVYELTETKAPDGYNLLTKKIKFTISDGTVTLNDGNDMSSISEENGKFVVTIENEPGVALPVTGGTGTILFSLGGMALMLIALGYTILMKRKEKGGLD